MATKKELDRGYYLKNREKRIKDATEWNSEHRKNHREYDRRWQANHPQSKRKLYLKRAYKISLEEYELIKTIQEGRCAICLEKTNRLVVDHDHKTGKVRSLLCTTCNAGMGQFKDDIELLAQTIAYLQRHERANNWGDKE